MIIKFGKQHVGKSVESVILKDPIYVKWVLSQADASGPLLPIRDEMIRLLAIFNERPFITKCSGPNCDRIATRASLYKDNPVPKWWCDECDPFILADLNPFVNRVQTVVTYEEVLAHVAALCRGRKAGYKYVIRAFAQAKGLPRRLGEKQVQGFFS